MEFSINSSPQHGLITILALTSVFALAAPSAAFEAEATKHFIDESCSVTTYPSLCSKTLAPYAASASVPTTRFSLCDAALAVAIQAAGNCSAAASKAASNSKQFEPAEVGVVKDCVEELKDAVYELKETVAAMAHLGDSAADRDFQWSNAKTYASAAITDAETCVDGFGERKVSVGLKKKMKGCVDDVEKLISNALSLINHLY